MSKPYLLAFSDSLGTQDQVKNWLNSIPEITTWRFDMPHSFYMISELDAKTIAEKLRRASGHDKGRFIVTEIPANSWGYLTGESWYMIQKLKARPK
jgi:hypothetical protein